MNYRKLELSVGAFVIAGLAAVAYLALKIGAGALMGADTYVVQARFANVAGLNAGANVAISGVTVGRVANITLNTENFGAIVDLEIRKDLVLSTDSIVSVKTRGLIGDKFLAILPGVEDEIVKPGGMLTETESTVDIESLVSRMAFGGVDKEESE